LKLIDMKSPGFTLLETVVAVAMLVGGVSVVYSTSANTLAHTYNNQYRLTASYLVQEGVEVVRNIRDQNWLDEEPDWRNGLAEGAWQVQYNSESLAVYSDSPLRVSSAGLYNYSEGVETNFRRKINIKHEGADKIRVTVEVTWPRDGGNPVRAEKFLYNWY